MKETEQKLKFYEGDKTESDQLPLFSFAIVSYNNYKYIFETVDSVLEQTYPKIELLISNDGASDFNEKELREYILKNKRENIVDFKIQNHPRNVGTVRNVESTRQMAHGEFIMYMAADDVLYDKYVLEKFVDRFLSLPSDAMVLSCRTAMCGCDIRQIMDYQPDIEGIKAIKNYTPQKMFSRLTHTFTIPTTSTCYRMALYDLVGPYDTDYFIIEDASLYLRISRLGIKIYWIDDMVAARHRDGGVSHSEPKKLSETYRKYRYDEVMIYQKEILPYQDRIHPKDLVQMRRKWEYIQHSYKETFQTSKMQKIRNRIEPFLGKVIEKNNIGYVNYTVKGTLERALFSVAVFSVLAGIVCGVLSRYLSMELIPFAWTRFWLLAAEMFALSCLLLAVLRVILFFAFRLLRFSLKIVTKISNKCKLKKCERNEEIIL